MPKTTLQWLETIQDDIIRELAITNYNADDSNKTDLFPHDDCLSGAIEWAFLWLDTKQGIDYWSKVRNNAVKMEITIAELSLPKRIQSILINASVDCIGDIMELGAKDLIKLRNINENTIKIINKSLNLYNLKI